MVQKGAIFLFVVIYAVYYFTLFPSVPGGDSGELLAEACQLGVAHPPGYPVFTVLAHWVMQLTFVPRYYLSWDNVGSNSNGNHGLVTLPSLVYDAAPTKAWYVNNFSAILSALAAVWIYLTVLEVLAAYPRSEGKPASMSVAMTAALLYACSPLIWEYAITAEVFALNNFLCSLVLYQTVLSLKTMLLLKSDVDHAAILTRLQHYVMLGGFVTGLALSNQHTSLLHVAFCVLSILFIAVKRLSLSAVLRSVLLPAAAMCLLALCSYSYLYFASTRHPQSSWGDTTTLEGWLRHVLRSEYGTFRLGSIVGQENAFERIFLYLKHTSTESFHLAFPVVAVGMWKYLTEYQQDSKKGKRESAKKASVVAVMANNKKHKKSSSEATAVAMEANQSNAQNTTDNHDKQVFFQLLAFLWLNWLFYTLVWHGVFSNLPLSSPMPYGVHARFWMQPSITFFAIFGITLHGIYDYWVMTSSWLANAVFVLTFALVLQQRYAWMDKSSSGWILHRYAQQTLQRIPPHSLLLAHTDLDLNPMRYLRLCEGWGGAALDHLSLQMLPYPWFAPKQRDNYPNFTFPALDFPGISSDRASEGNAEMIRRILRSNGFDSQQAKEALAAVFVDDVDAGKGKYFGGVYLDMQSVNELQIQPMSIWRDYVLLPWGSQYRVIPQPSNDPEALLRIMEKLHVVVWKQFKLFKEGMPAGVDASFLQHYPHGTWEAAVMNVFYDSHYQLGLFYLTYAIEKQQSKLTNAESLPLLLDRLLVAKTLLASTFNVVKVHQTFSSATADLAKNVALVYMRLFSIAKVCQQYKVRVFEAMKSPQVEMLEAVGIETLLASPEAFTALLRESAAALEDFVRSYPADVHIQVFQQSLQEVQKTLKSLQGTP